MTKFYEDIIRQPQELVSCLQFQAGKGRSAIEKALSLMKTAKYIFIPAIGASWNAGLAIHHSLNEAGFQSMLFDASEFCHFTKIHPQSVILFLSRSGRSVEIVNSVEKCRRAGAKIISITNDPESTLAVASDVCLETHVRFDHAISVNTYSSIILTGQLLARSFDNTFLSSPNIDLLERAISKTGEQIIMWKSIIDAINWPRTIYYFLARGADNASAHESKLLWEEAAKYPAVAMTTGAFRHGPQEIIRNEMQIILWIHHNRTKAYDLELVSNLQEQGVNIITIGHYEPCGFNKIAVPNMPFGMEAVINVIPMQLAAERFASIEKENSDEFRFCSFVVEKEGGL
ncbi:MAG: SIS domain-containing protein [Chitinophagaceae bacterium]|nr:SIS domain-containing protein [Chitinophagaceae bacterium]